VNEDAIARILRQAETLDLPIGKERDETDYELWACERIAAAGNQGVAYVHGSSHNGRVADHALRELQEQIRKAGDVPAWERRIYYTDVLRRYKEQAEWPVETKPLRSKFFVFSQKTLPLAMERAS
jgi:hypothetical protein